MAYYTSQFSIVAGSRGPFGQIADFINTSIKARMMRFSRHDQIEALEEKSDAELARLGLTRDQLAHHVFRDPFYA